MSLSRNSYLIMGIVVLVVSGILISAMDKPGYTDAYYYFNAGKSFAAGDGLTDYYLWNYVNAPDSLPTESHRYWMPLASLVAAIPMTIFGTGFHTAQIIFVPFLVGLVWLGMWLGMRIGGKRRHAYAAGLMVLFGGFYLPFWLTTDTFAVFGLVGMGALVALGLGREHDRWQWYALAGGLSALAHLARADGLLFVIVGVIVIWWKSDPTPKSPLLKEAGTSEHNNSLPLLALNKLAQSIALIAAYFIVMLPWFIRSIDVLGSPLPSGGIGTIFLHEYNDLFSYPAKWDLQYFLDWGWGSIINSRLDGLLFAFQNWLAVEGLLVLAPFALWALWKRRRDGFFAGVIWYIIGLHVAMSVVFTFPGTRGGLFHSSAAVYPFWIALGLAGLDDAIVVMARWRKWRVGEAQRVFGTAAILLPLALGWFAFTRQTAQRDSEPDYKTYAEALPLDARIMVNDPAAWYYHTDLIGVTLPDESLTVAREIAQRYCITYLVIDENVTEAFNPLIQGEAPPDFLTEIRTFPGTDSRNDVRIYRFDVTC